MTTLGLVELNSIAKGIFACDAMVKISDVEIIESYPVCPGKYVIMISGDVAAVEASVKTGMLTAKDNFVDKLVIPHVHSEIIPGILGTLEMHDIQAVGILETFSVASAIVAADTSLKASKVNLIEIRLAKGLGGKSFYTLTGSVAAVTSAIEAGALILEKEGVLVDKQIIPQPHESLKQQLTEW
ncbi:MAG: BMC domain-containing protein [Spirochaetes bacterium]|nr:BMC domain-containing protein [Spirochaetota bacterium]